MLKKDNKKELKDKTCTLFCWLSSWELVGTFINNNNY